MQGTGDWMGTLFLIPFLMFVSFFYIIAIEQGVRWLKTKHRRSWGWVCIVAAMLLLMTGLGFTSLVIGVFVTGTLSITTSLMLGFGLAVLITAAIVGIRSPQKA